MSLLVKATGIGKVYPRVHHPRDRLRAFGALLFGQEPADGAEVLKDINEEGYASLPKGLGSSRKLRAWSLILSRKPGSVGST